MEALKAQAIAARGQLVAKVGTRHLADPFLLCADQHCQVYAGQHREHPRTTSAVEQTAGKVALRAGGTQLVDTVYSANCGGHSEDNDAVWPSRPDPQLRARPDPLVGAEFRRGIDAENIEAWLTTAPRSFSRPPGPDERGVYRWEATVDPAVFAKDARFGARIGPLRHFEVLRRGRSGRALAVRAIGERGSVELEGELNIRRALGGLKSSMFVVATQRDRYGRFVLRGGGHGHGVGLCQHGAMGMAKSGHLHEQILSHYYSGCELAKLW
jgi:SpoIID/LytB domain protein